MPTPLPLGAGLEPTQDMLAVQREIAVAARRAHQSIPLEPLPREMALLLVRMAVAEALRPAATPQPPPPEPSRD